MDKVNLATIITTIQECIMRLVKDSIKGLCTAGHGCKYDHRCLECGKFGHGAHICRNKAGTDGKVNNSVPSGGANATAAQK